MHVSPGGPSVLWKLSILTSRVPKCHPHIFASTAQASCPKPSQLGATRGPRDACPFPRKESARRGREPLGQLAPGAGWSHLSSLHTPCPLSAPQGTADAGSPRSSAGLGEEWARWTRKPCTAGTHPFSLLLAQILPLNHSYGLRTGGLCKHIACFQSEVHNSFLSFIFFPMQPTDPASHPNTADLATLFWGIQCTTTWILLSLLAGNKAGSFRSWKS